MTQGLVLDFTDNLKSSPKLLNVIDIFCKGLNDSNLKVHIHTLNALNKAIPALGRAIEPHLGLIVNSLLVGLGSANTSIREIAKDVCNCLINNCESYAVIGPLAFAAVTKNSRARTTLIGCITEIIPKVYDKRPNLIAKNVIPLIVKLIDDSKVDVREECFKLVNKLYSIMDSGLFEIVPSGKIQKILEILNEGM